MSASVPSPATLVAARPRWTRASLVVTSLLALAVLGWPEVATAVIGGITDTLVDVAGWLPAPLCDALGRAADLVGVAAVVFGVAGALANSIILLRVGIDTATTWTAPTMGLQLTLLALLALAFMGSAATGIGRGIRWLSNHRRPALHAVSHAAGRGAAARPAP